MAKLTAYDKATRFDDGDILIKDGTNGTKKILAKDAIIDLLGMVSPEMHRNIYRGKNLGANVTEAQKTAIKNGTFDDLFIGDYWTSGGGVNWVIADMDYFYRTGSEPLTKHHLVIVPNTPLTSAPMNDTNDITGGYVGTKMRKETLVGDKVKGKIDIAFPDMVLHHREYLVNAVSNGAPSGAGWFDSTVELMNEIMVYGCHILAPMSTGTVPAYGYTVAKQQLALFALSPKSVNIGAWYWLRDARSASAFCYVYSNGAVFSDYASFSRGVRPYFLIGSNT